MNISTTTNRPISSTMTQRWLSSSTMTPASKNIEKSQQNTTSTSPDVIEKVFIGILGALIGAVLMVLIFFILLFYYQRRRKKRSRQGTGTHETSRTTTTTEDMTSMEETISSTENTSRRSSHLHNQSSTEDIPGRIAHLDSIEIAEKNTRARDFRSVSRHQRSTAKTLTVKKNRSKKFRKRPPKPTPRMRLSRKLVTRLLSSKPSRRYAVQPDKTKQYGLMYRVSRKKEQTENTENEIDLTRNSSGRRDKTEGLGLPSSLYIGVEGNKRREDDFTAKPRLRSTSDPRDHRFHNYVNYPIRSAPERIRDDSMLGSKLYIAETLSNCSSHDYVNLMSETKPEIQSNRNAQKGKKRPKKPPRYYLNCYSRKVVPAKICAKTEGQLQAPISEEIVERSTELNSSGVSRDDDLRTHVDIDELQDCFDNYDKEEDEDEEI